MRAQGNRRDNPGELNAGGRCGRKEAALTRGTAVSATGRACEPGVLTTRELGRGSESGCCAPGGPERSAALACGAGPERRKGWAHAGEGWAGLLGFSGRVWLACWVWIPFLISFPISSFNSNKV